MKDRTSSIGQVTTVTGDVALTQGGFLSTNESSGGAQGPHKVEGWKQYEQRLLQMQNNVTVRKVVPGSSSLNTT